MSEIYDGLLPETVFSTEFGQNLRKSLATTCGQEILITTNALPNSL